MSLSPLRPAASLVLAAALSACMPAIPPAPDLGHTIRPYSAGLGLASYPGGLTAGEREALIRLLADGRAAGARRVTVEVRGTVDDARKRTIRETVAAAWPSADVVFTGAGEMPSVALRGIVGVPRRCLVAEPWFADGLVPIGCASELALDRMIEDPNDLRIGRPTKPGDLAPLAEEALRYTEGDKRKTAVPATEGTATQGSPNTDVPPLPTE
jgi:type IV pilus biogenesis protein CpaD/CtpE